MEEPKASNTLSDTIELIRSFDCGNDETNSVAQQLSAILSRIPDGNVAEIYGQTSDDHTLKMGIRHTNDQFRLVNVLISPRIIGVTTCMMKDTLNRHVENSAHFNSLSEAATPFFEIVFGDTFEKEIVKRKGVFFECSLKFDDKRFSGRTYISKKNKWMKRVFGSRKHTSETFRYLSFFKEYDYFVKNVFVDAI